MKPINKDEIYEHLNSFLKSRGIELKDGSYARGIQQTCDFLADSINLGQEGMQRAKAEFDKNMDRMRQVIHERTAPNRPAAEAPPRKAKTASAANSTSSKPRHSRKAKPRKTQK